MTSLYDKQNRGRCARRDCTHAQTDRYVSCIEYGCRERDAVRSA